MSTCVAEEQMIKSPAVVFSGTPGPPVAPLHAVSGDSGETLRSIESRLDTTIYRLLMSARTADEFDSLRAELFQKYVALAGIMAGIIKVDFESQSVADVLEDSFTGIEQVFSEDQVLFADNDGSREEALFGIGALKRTHLLLCEIADTPAPPEQAEHDAGLLVRCLQAVWWSQLHLRCLVFAISHPEALPTMEVKDAILAGLRLSVMGYSTARQSWGIRFDSEFDVVESPSTAPVVGEEAVLLAEADADWQFILDRNTESQA